MIVVFKDGSRLYIKEDKITAMSINGNSTVVNVDAGHSKYEIDCSDVHKDNWNELLNYLKFWR